MIEMKMDNHAVTISNPDKLLFAEEEITKLDLAQYHRRIASCMLPHLRDRPLMLHRFPDGLESKGFYQKDASSFFPDWIPTVRVAKRQGGAFDAPVCNDAATLVYLANLASITQHLWLSRTADLDKPDRLVFDLDPSSADFGEVKFAARQLRLFLEGELDITPFLMTTGSRGLHVVVPVHPDTGFDQARKSARRIADLLAAAHPGRLTTEARKEKRRGRLYLDVARNAFGQTVVAPYSVRARPGAPVATPIDWKELASLRSATAWTMKNIFRRLAAKKDPWRHLDRHSHSLARVGRRLERL